MSTAAPPILERLALHRPELRAWALYDWANSVFMTTVLQVFPIYFATVAAEEFAPAEASRRFYVTTSLAVGLMAVIGPVLGALADSGAIKKRMLAACLACGVLGTAGLGFVGRGEWEKGALFFVIANMGATGSIVFYESLLPHVARPHEVDRLTTSAFALGYVSGGVLLAINVAWMTWPHTFLLASEESAVRASFLSAAVWWALFSIPILLRVAEPARRLEPGEVAHASAFAIARGRLLSLTRELRRHPDAFLLLLAFMIYNDGITTIIRLATTFGTEMGLPRQGLIAAVLMVQFVGAPFALLFGELSARIGPKRSIFVALAVYAGITVIGYRMTTVTHFFLLALLVATVQGGAQALSRSLFASLVPRHRSSEFFGFFGVFEKFAGLLGPLLFAGSVLHTGSSRAAILGLAGFFAVGALLLSFVDVERGRRAVREAEAAG